ncbi:MAG: OFA family MFS transporter [Nitrospiraceae bacterium]|nr:MAG: OFA family MFS transporter [Nitrospiraceae bacterium]
MLYIQEDFIPGKVKDRGIVVTAAGTGINLALGVLYTWSIFKAAIKQSIDSGGAGAFSWNLTSLNDPYAVCCLVFAFSMIIAGKCQDRMGPRVTAITGGVLVGLGFILISQSTAYLSWIIGFGFLVGIGIAFGYSSATPPALKWFSPAKTGVIAGIVVAGFGLASVYIAPLAQYLMANYGLQGTMLIFGISFMIVMCLLSLLLVNPPEGHVPKDFVERRADTNENIVARALFEEKNFTPYEMIRTPTFWMLWLMYFVSAGAGLMVIGSVAGMAKSSMGESAFLAVVILAIGNAGGRVVAGIVSDRIGRSMTLAGMLMFQALLMFAAVPVIGTGTAHAPLLVILATFIGFNYGANLALFPSFTKDYWGMKNFGVNYGIMFTAWGVGGFVMSRTSQALAAGNNSFTASFLIAGILLVVGIFFSFLLKDSHEEPKEAAQPLKTAT